MASAATGSLLEDDEQREHGQRRDHQQLVVVDVRDDLRLTRNERVEGGTAGGCNGIQELRDRRLLEGAIDRADVCHNLGVIDLRVLGQQRINDRNADARSDIALQIKEAGPLGPLLRRQRCQGHRGKRHEQKAETDALNQADNDNLGLRYVWRPAGRGVEGPRREAEAGSQ